MRRLLLALGLLALSFTPAASAAGGDVPGWTPVPCGCAHALAVDLVDTDRGFLGTDSGVSRTDNGGWTWKPLPFPVSGEVRRVSFADRDNGAVVGDFEGVVVTHDGGSTWTQYRPWFGHSLDVVALPDRWFGLAESGLYTSTDSGRVWTKVHGPFPPVVSYTRMSWYDPSNGVIANGASAFTTTDGGRTFTTVPTSAVFAFDAMSLGAGEAVVGGQQFVHSGRPWVGHIGGDRLTPYSLPTRGVADEQVHGLARSGSTFYAVGVEGLLARSTDAGSTWSYEATPPSYERTTFYDVDTLDADHAVVAVWDGRVLLRHAPRLHDVTTAPHRGVGLGLLVLTVGLGGAAGWALKTGRPKGLAYGLIGATLVAGAPGAFLALDTKSCHPGGCGSTLTATGGADDGFVTPPTPSPSATPSATPSPTASPTPSPTPSPSASPTPSPTASPTPSPTPLLAFSLSPVRQPSTCGVDQQTQQGVPMAVTFTLHNTTAVPVTWQATPRETDPHQQPWASVSPASGTVLPGASRTVTVTPTVADCNPGDGPHEQHVDVTYGKPKPLVATVDVYPATG